MPTPVGTVPCQALLQMWAGEACITDNPPNTAGQLGLVPSEPTKDCQIPALAS